MLHDLKPRKRRIIAKIVAPKANIYLERKTGKNGPENETRRE